MPIHSLIAHNNGVSGSTSTSWAIPLIVRRAMCFLLSPPFLEILVEIVEHLGAARDAFRIVLGRDADAFDQRPNARDLGAAELVVLEADVVDDLADGAQRGVLERAALQQHLERALVA